MFLIDGIISPGIPCIISTGVIESCQIIQSMAQAGNEAAARRNKDIENLYSSIESALGTLCPDRFNEWTLNGMEKDARHMNSSGMAYQSSREVALSTGSSEGSHLPETSNTSTRSFGESYAVPYSTEMNAMTRDTLGTDDFFPLSLDSQLLAIQDTDLHGMYYDPDLSLTGLDTSDWMELERLVQGFQGDF